MKKIIVLAASSFLFVAGSAFAGGAGGCHYEMAGEHAKASPVVDTELPTDPKLLAQLKKQQEEARELLQPTYN